MFRRKTKNICGLNVFQWLLWRTIQTTDVGMFAPILSIMNSISSCKWCGFQIIDHKKQISPSVTKYTEKPLSDAHQPAVGGEGTYRVSQWSLMLKIVKHNTLFFTSAHSF